MSDRTPGARILVSLKLAGSGVATARRDGALAALASLAPDEVAHDLLTGREAAAPEMRAAVANGMCGGDGALHVVMARLR